MDFVKLAETLRKELKDSLKEELLDTLDTVDLVIPRLETSLMVLYDNPPGDDSTSFNAWMETFQMKLYQAAFEGVAIAKDKNPKVDEAAIALRPILDDTTSEYTRQDLMNIRAMRFLHAIFQRLGDHVKVAMIFDAVDMYTPEIGLTLLTKCGEAIRHGIAEVKVTRRVVSELLALYDKH